MNDVVKPKRILYFYIHPAVDTTEKTLIYRSNPIGSAARETRCQDNDRWRMCGLLIFAGEIFLRQFFFFVQKYFLYEYFIGSLHYKNKNK